MADQHPEDFYESILNQPWDPVSYFEDEEESNMQDKDNGLSESQSRKLSELFDDLNLKSLESDIKRLSIRKQQSKDIPDSVFEDTHVGVDDTEEPSGSIDRFITYEDKEDHLKAVDTTDIINRKNIDSDMKRLAHFKQQSLDLSNQSESFVQESILHFPLSHIPENSSEAQAYVDDLIKVLPDVVQYDPSFPSESTQRHKSDKGNFEKANVDGESELDISHLLPEPVTDETWDENILKAKGNNGMDGSGMKPDQLIDIGIDNEINYVQCGNEAKHFGDEKVNLIESGGSHSSQESGDSLNQIIGQAETIVKDYAEKFDFKDQSQSEELTQQAKKKIYHDLDQDEHIIDKSMIHSYDIQKIKEDDMAAIGLLDDFGFESNRTDQGDRSVSSIHDELRSSSPTLDLCEPKFGMETVATSNLIDIEDNTQDNVDMSVRVKTSSSDKKEKSRKSKANLPKYVVDIVRYEDSDSDVDFDKDLTVPLPEGQQNMDMVHSVGALGASDQLVTQDVNIDKNTIDVLSEKETASAFSKSNDKNETQQDGEGHQLIAEGTTPNIEKTVLSEEALRISEQFVDEILNENVNMMEDLHPTAAVDHVFPNETSTTENSVDSGDANITLGIHEMNASSDTEISANASSQVPVDENASSGIIDNDTSIDSNSVARTCTRSGSTSDSEELEEFINQQLSESLSGASAASPEPARTNLLPPLDEEMQLGWYAPKWVRDKDAKGCMNCGIKFTVVKRRHHCRACGKVLCSNCCNMKAELAYLSYKTSRVCQACFETLSKAHSLSPLPLMSGSQDVPGRGHTISLNDSEPGTSAFDSPPQYMPESPPEYSVLPGSAAQNGPPNPPSYFASVRGSGFRARTESDRSAVIMFNSSQTDLPPILCIENEVVKIINNPNLNGLFEQLKDKAAEPVAFLVNKNLVVKVKVVSLDCCISKECWCFSSDGMGASNQEEIVFVVEYKGDDQKLLKCVFQQFNLIFERAKYGEPLSDFGYIPIDEYMQNNSKNVGMILFKPNVQCVKNLVVPCHPYLFGLWIQQSEVPWAKNLPLRLLIRLGAEFKSYPYPVYNLEDREPVFNVVGRTIIALLADFRSFQYTLPKISGLLVSVTKKDTTIKLPQTRYDEVLKVLNTSEESVMAFSGNFNRKADSHLVCVETDGTHATQTISCRTSSKKLTGCSFVVFSAALKSSTQNLQAKTSIVEDGIMVQVTSETMKKIRSAMKEMQDLVTPAGEAAEGSNEVHKMKIIWGSSDDSSSRISSPIDGSSFDGLTNMRIRHSYDFTVSTSPAKIHWQEVYFLPNDADTVGRLSAKELSQMTSSVAKACMNALSPHLSTLVALEMTKIGLRMILDAELVEYRIGSNNEQLPQELIGDLDDKLIPVIHSVVKTVSHRRISAELIFQITRIV